jgi:SAM-dependent methyltransferase
MIRGWTLSDKVRQDDFRASYGQALMQHGGDAAPSLWVARFLDRIRPGGAVLDLAAGSGRHTRLLLERGFAVTAADRDVAALQAGFAPNRSCRIIACDLESGAPWPLGGGFDGIIVANYLHRPLFPTLAQALAPGGVLIYETFMQGHERFGKPSNPDFLLRANELREAFAALAVIAFEQGEVAVPRPAMLQRLAAAKPG